MEVNLGTVTTVLKEARQRLVLAGCETPQLDAELLLAFTLGRERDWLYLYPQAGLAEAEVEAFFRLVARREEREPVAYLTGHKAFFGMEFLVNPFVLIPRPETELLVETAIELTKKHGYLSIVDVGTGSGCIAVSLAKYLPQTTIWAIDLSEQALQTAGQNAERRHVRERVTFLKGDLLSPLPGSVDLIASNPPYVRKAELAAPFTIPEVYRYEPRLALDGGEDGLQVVSRLLAQASPKLKPGGAVLVEIGAAQGQAVARLAQAHFPGGAVKVKSDLAGLDRLVVIQT